MPDTKISGLPAGATPSGSEPIPAVQGGATVSLTAKQIADSGYCGIVYQTIKGVNFNAANTDNAIPIVLPAGFTRFVVSQLEISHASGALTTATAGLFTAAAAGGAPIAANQAVTVSTASENTANNAQSMSVTAGAQSYLPSGFSTPNTVYFRIGTPQGVAATADVTLQIKPLP